MNLKSSSRYFHMVLLLAFAITTIHAQTNTTIKPQRDPNQPIDEEYTKKIAEYRVPSPEKKRARVPRNSALGT